MGLKMKVRRMMEQDLRKALPAGEFELHYQPVVNLASNKISGFEAVIRWNHPERGLVAPPSFIPLAERLASLFRWANGSSDRHVRPQPNGPTISLSRLIFQRLNSITRA